MCWLLPPCWTCWALPGVPGDEGKSVSSGRSGVSTGRRSRVPVPWFIHLLEEVATCRWSLTLATECTWTSEALSGLRRAVDEGCMSADLFPIVIEAPDIVLGKG